MKNITYPNCHATVLSTSQPERVEPVAWRTKNDFGHWHVTQNRALAETWIETEKFEVQPLYAAQPASPLRGTDNPLRAYTVEQLQFELAIRATWKSASPPEQPAADPDKETQE